MSGTKNTFIDVRELELSLAEAPVPTEYLLQFNPKTNNNENKPKIKPTGR